MHNLFRSFFLLTIFHLYTSEPVQQSISGSIPTYQEVCLKAVEDPYYFQSFRSIHAYSSIVECGLGRESVRYLLKNASKDLRGKLDILRKIDQYGNPDTNELIGVGRFSGTTLRYIVIADQITKIFRLPEQPKIAEIGGGFGGQCYILSHLAPFSRYYIFDLPVVERLIEKMMNVLSVQNVYLVPFNDPLPEETIDLFISNYAFSECSRQTQLSYFNRVIRKADRGYILFNNINHFDSLSVEELVGLLHDLHKNPEVRAEPIYSHKDNVLITWDVNNE